MARTKRRGKVARKSRVQTRRNNAMKPRVQSRRNNNNKIRRRSKRVKRKSIRGGDPRHLSRQQQLYSLLKRDDVEYPTISGLYSSGCVEAVAQKNDIKYEKDNMCSLYSRHHDLIYNLFQLYEISIKNDPASGVRQITDDEIKLALGNLKTSLANYIDVDDDAEDDSIYCRLVNDAKADEKFHRFINKTPNYTLTDECKVLPPKAPTHGSRDRSMIDRISAEEAARPGTN